MAGNPLFYYFGDDEAYFKALQTEFSKQSRLVIDFVKMFESDEKRIQSLFIKVFKKNPKVVFIDFSSHSLDYLHLARILTRTPLENKIVTVGLLDYLSPPEILVESNATGVNLSYIKSTEFNDVIFDVSRLISPNDSSEHGFAKASLKEEWEGGVPVKIGYVHQQGMHFETDYPIQKGDRLRIHHPWEAKRIVPSKEFFIQNVTNQNLFYHFSNAVDAEFLYVDEFLPPEGMDEATITEKRKERDDLIDHHKHTLKKWIDDNLSASFEKKSKILVIDRDFQFYNDQQRTDRHPFTIRCVPFIDDISRELDRMHPQVVVFALEKPETTNIKNTPEVLSQLLSAIKTKFPDAPPFVVVFNTKISSKDLQNQNKFPNIMGTDTELSVEVLLKMAAIFEKKLKEQNMTIQNGSDVKKVFLKKSDTKSLAEILVPITVLKISETDITFQTSVNLPIGTNIHLTKPVNMFINVQPSKNQGKVPEYHGLIHSLGEVEKKELRRYVNTVFFRDHDAQVSAETEEFKKLNEAKLQAKQEALAIAVEEAREKEEEKQREEERKKTADKPVES